MKRPAMKRFQKFLPLLLLVVLLPLLSGCFGGGAPLPKGEYTNVRTALTELDQLSPTDLKVRGEDLQAKLDAARQAKQKPEDIALLQLQRAYVWERQGGEDPGLLTSAVGLYRELSRTPLASVAAMRIAQIDGYRVEREKTANPEQARVYRQSAIKALEQLTFAQVTAETFIRKPAVGFMPAPQPGAQWQLVPARTTANQMLDPFFRDTWQYQMLELLVRLSGGAQRNSSYIIAILLIAVIAKLITTPFSVAQFRSMRAMQLFQPELKKLQEKYKDDKQGLARAQMELMKEHKINPASSCLPMILQMVILIQVYYAIRHFIAQFQHVHFLYLSNMANPDTLLIHGIMFPGPLLILYAASMYFTQKLISMPAATPEQQQQQKMMAIMMPFLMLMIMQSLPAAFILYWLLQNVLMTGHQYLIMRPHRAADAAAAAAAAASSKSAPRESAPKEETTPPPPEAIERLTQGRKPAKKKRKRRY